MKLCDKQLMFLFERCMFIGDWFSTQGKRKQEKCYVFDATL